MFNLVMIKNCLILITLLNGVLFCFGSEPKLSITASTDKQTYGFWEVIELTVTVTNESSDTIAIYSPDFWGVSKIDIYDTQGNLVSPSLLKVNRTPDEDIWKIPPYKSRSHTYDNLIWYSCCFGNVYSGYHLIPGNYLINLALVSPPDRYSNYLKLENNWTGILYANTVRLTISGSN